MAQTPCTRPARRVEHRVGAAIARRSSLAASAPSAANRSLVRASELRSSCSSSAARVAAEDEPHRQRDPLRRACGFAAHHPLRQPAGGFDERSRRSSAPAPAAACSCGLRGPRRSRGRRRRTRSSPAARSCASRTCTGCGDSRSVAAVRHVVVGAGQLLPQARRLVRLHRRPADLLDQQPAGGQRLIANHLGRQPQPRPAGEQPVLRIAARAAAGVTADDCR